MPQCISHFLSFYEIKSSSKIQKKHACNNVGLGDMSVRALRSQSVHLPPPSPPVHYSTLQLLQAKSSSNEITHTSLPKDQSTSTKHLIANSAQFSLWNEMLIFFIFFLNLNAKQLFVCFMPETCLSKAHLSGWSHSTSWKTCRIFQTPEWRQFHNPFYNLQFYSCTVVVLMKLKNPTWPPDFTCFQLITDIWGLSFPQG